MTAYKDRSREELLQEKELLEAKFQEIRGKGLKLDMSRLPQLSWICPWE